MNLTFDIPSQFYTAEDALDKGKRGEIKYLKYLAYEGVKKRYPDLTEDILERLNFELQFIEYINCSTYFLIVQDIIKAAREMGVYVGPGRGTVGGSIVAYCTGITNVDPIKHNLLFERFLYPERISIPDIDIDFDAEGLPNVFKYIIDKYGSANVAKIICEETMPEKHLIGKTGVQMKSSIQNAMFHACGVVVAPNDIIKLIPETIQKDSNFWCTEYAAEKAEDFGLLKLDFIGLKALSILKDALTFIKEKHGIVLIPEDFPLNDHLTFQLFQNGLTDDIFQFESADIQKYLKELKPTKFTDLVAINALNREGSIEFIPYFIKLKNKDAITYYGEWMFEYLSETYGMTIYQEQMMLLSQKIAGFTKRESYVLRKAMAKKQKEILNKMLPIFIENGKKNGYEEGNLKKLWKEWEQFSAYAFNKSHATCYTYIAYQMAYLKAHFPLEYLLSVKKNDINKSN